MTASSTAGDLGALKSRNRASLLEWLRRQPGLTRAELAQRTALTKVTVGAAVQTLLDQGWLVEGDLLRGGSGRPGRALSLNPDSHAILGIEIGVHGLHVLAINFHGLILAQRHQAVVPTRPDDTLDQIVPMVRELIRTALSHRTLLGVGLAVPGPTSPEQSRLSLAPNLGWRDVPLLEMLRQRLPELDDDSRRFWCMDNEAKAAAFGELYCSPSSGQEAATPSSLLYVSAATGIGSGLVVQGTPPRVIRGVHGLAGEIGHTLLAPGGKPCHCGNHGCAETLVSGWALRDALGIEAGASLSEGIKHHRDPDLVAETLNQAGEALGLLLLNLHLTLNPERIVIGGSLVKLGAPLLDPALAFFTRHQNHLLPQAPPIPVRILDDSLATAARGAAAQVLCQLLARHDEFATDE
ncbi:ROK family protein [Halomonas sp. EF61]|uniref:ROK family transcriptional regulator n=1 Tax=Halomonas sp. EF61 TaxID=2950869 RepID=UPI0032DF3BC9